VALPPEDLRRQQEIQSSLKSIVETSDKWLRRFKRRQLQIRLISSFLAAILIFFGILALGAATIVITNPVLQQNPNLFGAFFQQHPELFYPFIGAAFLLAPVVFLLTYFLLRWNQLGKLKELSALIKQMKKRIAEEEQSKGKPGGGEGVFDDALSMTDKIVALLPVVAPRKRNLDSILFGVLAFIFASIIGQNGAVGILVGIIVWLYFRYETSKIYEREITKFEQQRKVYEQRKNDFLETL
jgi:hypothetical protein